MISKDLGSKWLSTLLSLPLAVALAGCGGDNPRVGSPALDEPAEGVEPDEDAGGLPLDDAGDAGDGGAGEEEDAGSAGGDAALPDEDAGEPDEDAGDPTQDAGAPDGGPVDSGPVDSGPVDSGPVDPEPVDSGSEPEDAGPPPYDAGVPARASCRAHLRAGAVEDGPYPIDPDGDGTSALVWCDMTTDDGGWTLVGSTRGQTMNDERSPYYEDLARADPTDDHPGVWEGLRPLISGHSDVRFTCKVDADAPAGAYDVDLSFYDVGWYREITTGSDADACFEEDNGAGYTGPWARRNNLTGEEKGADDDYVNTYQGYPPHMEGEDSCGDEGDFVVDFDDRGMDSVVFDGTDWGEDDHGRKCGSVSPTLGSWQLWVREPGAGSP